MKKHSAVVMAFALVILFSGPAMVKDSLASSTSDDIQWIARCMSDNRNQGQSAEVIRKYCECMVSKMDDDETQSVTEWENSILRKEKRAIK
jgi:hypothetical protein